MFSSSILFVVVSRSDQIAQDICDFGVDRFVVGSVRTVQVLFGGGDADNPRPAPGPGPIRDPTLGSKDLPKGFECEPLDGPLRPDVTAAPILDFQSKLTANFFGFFGLFGGVIDKACFPVRCDIDD
jgi:hypothetical protein